MCTVAGVIDFDNVLEQNDLNQLIKNLAKYGEVRGNQSGGIAYVSSEGILMTHIEPRKPSKINFCVPPKTKVVSIHCRYQTLGDYNKNYNNHPFLFRLKSGKLATLCHNGMLVEIDSQRKTLGIEDTPIQTDSYFACQLLSKNEELTFETIGKMAETVQGNFVFTILEEDNTVWIIKGENPLSLLQISRKNGIILIYASTDEILYKSLLDSVFFNDIKNVIDGQKSNINKIFVNCGDVLRFSPDQTMERGSFEYNPCVNNNFGCGSYWSILGNDLNKNKPSEKHISDLLMVCKAYGYDPETVQDFLDDGYTPDEIESLFFDS